MRPDQSGIMVSVETLDNGKQFFKAIELKNDVPYVEYQKLENTAKELGTHVQYIRYQKNV